MKKGLGWIVGDGQDIRIWSDPWLSLAEPFTPIGPPTEADMSTRVKDLLHPLIRDRNFAAIRLHLPHYEDYICKLIPASYYFQDELVWLPNKSGVYSNKTGYVLAKLNGSTGGADEFNWKACIWQINTSPKLKHFLWKANVGALAVGTKHLCRGINTEGVCRRCGEL